MRAVFVKMGSYFMFLRHDSFRARVEIPLGKPVKHGVLKGQACKKLLALRLRGPDGWIRFMPEEANHNRPTKLRISACRLLRALPEVPVTRLGSVISAEQKLGNEHRSTPDCGGGECPRDGPLASTHCAPDPNTHTLDIFSSSMRENNRIEYARVL